MGIAGAGMSALAMLARHRGIAITGCDTDTSGTGADDLIRPGSSCVEATNPHHVEGARAIVVTAAVPPDHPELEKARALGLPVVRRADALGDWSLAEKRASWRSPARMGRRPPQSW